MALHHFLEELQCCGLVAGLVGEGFQDFALVIDGPPQIVLFAVDLHEDLVEVPAPMGMGPHAVNELPADLSGEHRPEAVRPEPTVSLLASIPRSASTSSTFLGDSGHLTYIDIDRITSGDELKQQNGLGGARLTRVGYHRKARPENDRALRRETFATLPQYVYKRKRRRSLYGQYYI